MIRTAPGPAPVKPNPALPAPPISPAAPPDLFPPSPELAAALERMTRDQQEVDRRKAEELARLRAIQDRD